MLWKKNTKQCVGWAVCKYAGDSLCDFNDAIKTFEPKVRKAAFPRHVQVRNQKSKSEDLLTVLGDRKSLLKEAAAFTSGVNNIRILFCENNKGILQFSGALLEVGQS